ncbi:MAG: helix-turn-helix transcriptional regulator [Ruminococcaceae bacterium]|nr:helix-turn-helix transcriptional regulator [Oscillospiraceae bacterium]
MAIIYETKWSGIHAWHRQAVGFMHQHLHDYVEIIYIRSNEMHFYVNFEEYTLHAGDVVFAFPGQIHGHEKSNSENIVLLFPKNLPIYDGVFAKFLPDTPFLRGVVDEELDTLFLKATQNYSTPEIPYSKGITQGYIALILGKLLPRLTLVPTDKKIISLEQRLIEYCSLHYREQISLSSVATALGYSSTHLSHLFADKFKVGFSKFISTMRIEDAKKMLRGDKSITQIALDCGFGSMRNFNRAFKEATNTTPSEYRKMGK